MPKQPYKIGDDILIQRKVKDGKSISPTDNTESTGWEYSVIKTTITKIDNTQIHTTDGRFHSSDFVRVVDKQLTIFDVINS